MQRYGAYRDSGIEWIGEIPEGWELLRMKRIGSFAKGTGIKKDEVLPEGMPCVRYGELYTTYEHRIADPASFVSDDLFSHSARLHNGEVVFALTGENEEDIGRCVVNLSGEALAVGGDTLAFTGHRQDGRFIAYSCNSKYFNVQRTLFARGGIIVHLPAGAVINATIVLPPLPEQQAIADYLDEKTAEIDSIVSQTERSIELLREYRKSVISEAVTKGLDPNAPMRDSGIEWIGEIPTGWGIGRMGDIAQYKKGPFGSSLTIGMFVDEKRAVAKVYEQKNAIQADASLGHYYIDAQKYKELEAFEVKPGDIIVSCAGTIGKCFEIPVGAYPGIINQALMRVRLNSGLDKRYFLFLFEVVLDAMAIIYSNGSAIKNIPPFSTLKPFKIPLPFFEKQQAIADYLDEKTAEIDSLIADKQRQVELLREYRKSLISEAVTGKFKVPGLE